MNLQEGYYIPKLLLHRTYWDSRVSHLGNTAFMYVSIESTRSVGNVEVGGSGIILFQKLRRLVINLLKSRDPLNLWRIF